MTGLSRYQRDALCYYGGQNRMWHDLFTKRNLWALATIRHAINEIEDAAVRDGLMFGLTGMTLNSSKMYHRARQSRYFQGDLLLPQVFREMVVTNGFDYKVETHLMPAFEELARSSQETSASRRNPPRICPRSRRIRSIISLLIRLMPTRSNTASRTSSGKPGSDSIRAGTTKRSSSTRSGEGPRRIGRP